MEERRKLELFYKYLRKECSREEYEEFVKEFDKKDIHKNFDHLFDAYVNIMIDENNSTGSTEGIENEARKVLQTAKRKERFTSNKNTRFFQSTFIRIAAVLVLAVSITLVWNTLKNNGSDSYELTAENNTQLQKSTGYGELSNVTLSDGSQVKLNAGSKICFDEKFTGKTRRVSLRGQAFFDVARDENKPFIIQTGDLDISVLGTSFDVKAFEDDDFALVTVVSGKVKVSSEVEEYIITPNEQVYFQKSTGKIIKRDVRSEDFIKWMDGTLYFDKTNVGEMIKQLERWYNVKIIVNAPEVLTKTVSGEYTNENLTSILKTMAFSLNVDYEIEGNEIILNKSI
nr:FecR domain-containing protein [uncultured Draconibacterium sp.]